MLQHNKVVIAKWKYNNAMMLKLWEQNENNLWKQSETWEHHLLKVMLEQIVRKKWGVGSTLRTIERRSQKEKTQ
jgi:hypothetical protein